MIQAVVAGLGARAVVTVVSYGTSLVSKRATNTFLLGGFMKISLLRQMASALANSTGVKGFRADIGQDGNGRYVKLVGYYDKDTAGEVLYHATTQQVLCAWLEGALYNTRDTALRLKTRTKERRARALAAKRAKYTSDGRLHVFCAFKGQVPSPWREREYAYMWSVTLRFGVHRWVYKFYSGVYIDCVFSAVRAKALDVQAGTDFDTFDDWVTEFGAANAAAYTQCRRDAVKAKTIFGAYLDQFLALAKDESDWTMEDLAFVVID